MFNPATGKVGISLKYLQPPFPSEIDYQGDTNKCHEAQKGEVTPSPSQFRYELKIHSIDTGNKSEWYEYGSKDG